MVQKIFSGARQRKTRWAVRWADHAARWLIVGGGIGTVLAVSLVCVFLVYVVVPLFLPGHLGPPRSCAWNAGRPLRVLVDEYDSAACMLATDGRVSMLQLADGAPIDRQDFLAGRGLSAIAVHGEGGQAAFGFADGKVSLGTLGFAIDFVSPDSLPEALRHLRLGEIAPHDQGLVALTPGDQLRVERLSAKVAEPLDLGLTSGIRRLDMSDRAEGPLLSVLTEDGQLLLASVSKKNNLLTGEVEYDCETSPVPLAAAAAGRPAADYVLLSGLGDNVYVAWTDGTLLRFDTSDWQNPRLAEKCQLLKDGSQRLTALEFALGKTTLVSGDSQGMVRAWFTIKPDGVETCDGSVLVAAHEFPATGSEVTVLAPSARRRTMVVGDAAGDVRLYYLSNERLVVRTQVEEGGRIEAAALAPRDNGLLAITDRRLASWSLEPGHPEVTLASLFRPVWYEGYSAPAYIWQSSSGSEDIEPKLSLVPLIFGTLKATLYSMLFGVPLALCGAIYTSEFLEPSAKARVKPAIEMMASLPSVVLGFLAGLVLAPFVERVVPSLIASFFTVPLAFLLGAYIWQLLPQQWSLLAARRRFWWTCVMLPVGIVAAVKSGPPLEQLLFGGDVRAWLDGHVASPLGGWVVLLMPLCAVAVGWLVTQHVNFMLQRWAGDWGRTAWVWLDFAKFLAAVACTILLAWLLAALLTLLGFDPRGGVVGTYVQRNALVVGFVMGFAIIPIMYTIAEDALSTVPEHLRSASLGAGATPWQTALRIIIPTAMSGLFSAMMIGLGRAIGETMIVLMGAGNAPIMDWNMFNGFQTLSALIATEMPESVRDSTHHRTLFLAALTLFLLTFALNTVAEIIRLRFRRRAYEL